MERHELGRVSLSQAARRMKRSHLASVTAGRARDPPAHRLERTVQLEQTKPEVLLRRGHS